MTKEDAVMYYQNCQYEGFDTESWWCCQIIFARRMHEYTSARNHRYNCVDINFESSRVIKHKTQYQSYDNNGHVLLP